MTVYVVEDLEFFKECARSAKYRLYREREMGDEVEMRLRAGSMGFRKVLKKNDPELKQIREFIEREGFVRVVGVEQDDAFFL